jgi:hypothetical protein
MWHASVHSSPFRADSFVHITTSNRHSSSTIQQAGPLKQCSHTCLSLQPQVLLHLHLPAGTGLHLACSLKTTTGKALLVRLIEGGCRQ